MTIVAIVSRQRLTGKANGSSTYLLDLAGAVRAAGLEPVLVQPSPGIMGRTPFARVSGEMGVFARHHVRGVLRLGHLLVSTDPSTWRAAARGAVAAIGRRLGRTGAWTRDRPLPYTVSVPWSLADHAYVRRNVADARVVLADYVFQAEAFADRAGAAVSTGIVMHDLFSARDASAERGSGRDAVAGITAAEEAGMLARANAVIAIQRSEAEWVARHVPDTRAILAPMAVAAAAAPAPGEDGRLLFVGSGTAFNVVGLRWFLDAVWPRIRKRHPSATLDVAGSIRRAFSDPVPGVRFLGMVDRLDDHYAQAGVVISPLTAGSGLKIKLVEAMAEGKAVVVTSVTLQGVEAECEGAVVLADDAADFADAVNRLLFDRPARAALAARALDAARTHFSADSCHADLVAWLRDVAR